MTALISYTDLISAWQDWLDTPEHVVLDRWFKQRAKSQRRLLGQYRMQLDNAMLDALKYQQLADALEYSFQDPDFDNWLDWDQHWQPQQRRLATPQHFWYWIQLRSQSEWHSPAIAQQKARRDHFAEFKKQVESSGNNALLMLWHGIQPQLEHLLWQRADRSDWNEATVRHWVEQQSIRPPLWLRSQSDQPLETLQQQLYDEGVRCRVLPTSESNDDAEQLLAALGGKDVTRTEVWKTGVLEIQDAASQMICAAVDARSGQKIWDVCAGAGGKTLALATALGKKGSVTATDLHKFKLEELKRRAKRAGLLNIRSFEWDGEAPLRLPKEIAQQQGFDRILVDAPCSNAGTWRRNPDARWRLTADNVQELSQLQLKLLTHASKSLRSGGKLIYATCSWLVAENEDVIAAFLDRHPGFELVSQQIVGTPAIDSDTMFCAVLQHKN